MDITPQVDAGRQLINSYGNGGFRISGRRYEGSVLVLADRVVPVAAKRVSDLTVEFIADFKAANPPQILFVGCGASIAPLPDVVRTALSDLSIAVELMDTGAACRTHNVLVAEGRRAAALLIATD